MNNSFERSILCALLYPSLFVAPVGAGEPSPAPQQFDVLIKGGTVYDGTGAEGRVADVAIRGDRIASIGDLQKASAKNVIDAHGLAVPPGFINMLSWSMQSL